jgi:predicted membrane chloride channel (bestrophin family)
MILELDRWWACRGLWATIFSTSRTMMMNIWLNFREDEQTTEHNEDKVTILKLIIAYSVALKNYCREKPGLHHADLATYLPDDFVEAFDGKTPKIVPLEIIKLLYQYITMLERAEKLDLRTTGVLLAGLNTFTDQVSNAERILTPWPLAYSIHLKVWRSLPL